MVYNRGEGGRETGGKQRGERGTGGGTGREGTVRQWEQREARECDDSSWLSNFSPVIICTCNQLETVSTL